VPAPLTLRTEVRGPLSVHCVEEFREFGVDAFVTDRFGGVSPAPYDSLNLASHVGDDIENVLENRRRVADALGVGTQELVIVRQVHGSNVLDVSDASPTSEADGLFASRSDLALVMLVADCVPILLVDDESSDFAVVHAGWRGLSSRVLANAVAKFQVPARLHAFIGPCISGEGYQVGPEVVRHFIGIDGAVSPDAGDRSRLDLRRVAASQLLGLGVDDALTRVSTQSTDGGGLFFSDRAQRPCGRFALVARRVLA